ncbi:hypothetical protein IWW51_000317 [Coemansia sp. RSA 2702]|nr:hypothetical protein IWW51_000317 [Coemansia sp. RSA 2702]
MSQYGGSNEQIQDYLHGYGPSKGAGQRSLSRAGDAPAGESASYDKLPHNQYHHDNRPPHHASYGKPSQSFVGDSQTLYDQPSRPHRSNTKSRIQEAERNVADFFYKKPDPTYAGMYGTDYEPQISVSTRLPMRLNENERTNAAKRHASLAF